MPITLDMGPLIQTLIAALLTAGVLGLFAIGRRVGKLNDWQVGHEKRTEAIMVRQDNLVERMARVEAWIQTYPEAIKHEAERLEHEIARLEAAITRIQDMINNTARRNWPGD